MTEVIFQDVIVKTDLFTINYQVKVPKRMQDRVYLVANQVVVASFNAASFPDNYKEALLTVCLWGGVKKVVISWKPIHESGQWG